MRKIMALLCLLAGLAPFAAAAQETPVIVLLHSYHRAAWSDAVNEGVASVLGAGDETIIQDSGGLAVPYALRTEYMDTKWLESAEYLDQLEALFDRKYGNRHVIAVMAVDDHAYRFALERACFGTAPVFFCGVNSPKADPPGRRSSGVRERADFEPTLRWALSMFPETERIVLIEDATETGQANSREFLSLMEKFSPKLDVVRTGGLSFDGLKHLLLTEQENTIAFFNAFWRDAENVNISVNELALTFGHSRVPIFGRSQWMMGMGLVGGLCVIGQDQGRVMAELTRRYLSTGSFQPGAADSPNRFMVDWEQLSRFGKTGISTPDDAIIINKPDDFWKRYGPVLVPGGAILILVISSAVLLAFLSIKLRAARDLAAGGLAEKETLLKEVHHRVKNNLQVMKSLFNLQRRDSDPRLESAFDAASNRLHAMAMVHDRLYRDGHFNAIDLLAYTRDMADEVMDVYSSPQRGHAVRVFGQSCELSIDHAVPVGLFLNEALTNAVKYSRPNPASPIEVRVNRAPDAVTVVIHDSGDGFDEQKADSPGLGLTLMKAMADQLHGSLSFRREDGFSVSLSFPIAPQAADGSGPLKTPAR